MSDAFSLIRSSQAKLSQTAKAAKKPSPHDELMQHRVTPETKLPPLEFLFKMNGTECFPLSELVAPSKYSLGLPFSNERK